MELYMFLSGYLSGVAIMSLLFWGPGWLRALRSRWWSRSESRPYQDTEWHQGKGTNIKDCHICNPQATSPQPSAQSSEAEAGKTGG